MMMEPNHPVLRGCGVTQVAVLCNHQKSVAATHGASMEKQGVSPFPQSTSQPSAVP